MSLSKRKYLFDLPYSIPAAYIVYGIPKLKRAGIFEKLPAYMQQKMLVAADKWRHLRVTKKDLDSIDDQCWSDIASMLDLKWQYDAIKFDQKGTVRTPKDKK